MWNPHWITGHTQTYHLEFEHLSDNPILFPSPRTIINTRWCKYCWWRSLRMVQWPSGTKKMRQANLLCVDLGLQNAALSPTSAHPSVISWFQSCTTPVPQCRKHTPCVKAPGRLSCTSCSARAEGAPVPRHPLSYPTSSTDTRILLAINLVEMHRFKPSSA